MARWTNPDTGSDIETDGDDFTVTILMQLPQPSDDDKEN